MVVLFGKPKAIKANGIMDSCVDGEGSILFSYKLSKITDSYLPCDIQGENAKMVLDKINQPRKTEICYKNGTIQDMSKPGAKSFDVL
jgi:scyllo-inositol 2-dehydrogenase (NADP+)